MALENITEIEQAFGLEEGKLSEMITSEEKHSIDLSTLLIEPKAIYEERIANIKTSSSAMAKEVAIKKIKTTLGLDFEGKTEENLVEALTKKFETIKEEVIKDPEQRYVALKTDFEKLQGNLQAEINKRTQLEVSFENDRKIAKIQNDVFKHIPENTLVSKNTILIEANQKGFTFEVEDGSTVIKDSKGEIIKDEKTFSPIQLDSWMKSFITPYIKPVEGGGGGGDDTHPNRAGSFEAFEKEADKNDWSHEKKNSEMAKRIKDGTLTL
jgi:hypothetical protein